MKLELASRDRTCSAQLISTLLFAIVVFALPEPSVLAPHSTRFLRHSRDNSLTMQPSQALDFTQNIKRGYDQFQQNHAGASLYRITASTIDRSKTLDVPEDLASINLWFEQSRIRWLKRNNKSSWGAWEPNAARLGPISRVLESFRIEESPISVNEAIRLVRDAGYGAEFSSLIIEKGGASGLLPDEINFTFDITSQGIAVGATSRKVVALEEIFES